MVAKDFLCILDLPLLLVSRKAMQQRYVLECYVYASTFGQPNQRNLRRGDRLLRQRLLEHLQSDSGLIVGHLVTSAIDLKPAEVAYVLVQTTGLTTDCIRLKSLAAEGRRAGVVDGIGHSEATLVVADPI